MNELKTPLLNLEELQEAANQAAQKAVLKSIDDYYNSYNSPFKKSVEAYLGTLEINTSFSLPDILSEINHALSAEVDKIVNQSIALTYIPLLNQMLTRAEKEIKFSDLLKKFLDVFSYKDYKSDQVDLEITKGGDGFMYAEISVEDSLYRIGFSNRLIYSNKKEYAWEIFSLPVTIDAHPHRSLEIIAEGVTIKMPFTHGVVKDQFVSYLASLCISKTKIEMDCEDFDEEWFYKDDCHC